MKGNSDAKFLDPPIGTTVRVLLPYIDRAKTNARSVLVKIIIKNNLKKMYIRYHITLSKGKNQQKIGFKKESILQHSQCIEL